MTLEQLKSLDFAALWASLPPDRQVAIGTLAIKAEFATQVEVDGGFDTTHEDRLRAEVIKGEASEALPGIVWAAFPDLLPITYDEPYPLWQMLESREPPAEVDVLGLGIRPLIKDGSRWLVPNSRTMLELGGAVDLNSRDEESPRAWQFWTVSDIDAERSRRHPEKSDVTPVQEFEA